MNISDRTDGAIALGRQMTVEFYDCSAAILADAVKLEQVFLEAARVSGAHVVNSNFHSFEPQGVSGVLVISESHFAVHAWPEHDYAAVDLFTCGTGVDFDAAVKSLGAGMKSGQWIISSMVNRGILHESGELERLVPVVENERTSGLQLSWKERFSHSQAKAMAAGIDIYRCEKIDFTSESDWHEFVLSMRSQIAPADRTPGTWSFTKRAETTEFSLNFDRGRVGGFISLNEKTVYLDIFTAGFFDPRELAEAAMLALGGTYYRMQPQIRQ